MKSKLYWFQEFKAVSRQNIASSFNSGFCTVGFIFRDSGMVRRQPESAVLYCSLSRLSNTPTESHCFWLNDVVNHEPVTIKKKNYPLLDQAYFTCLELEIKWDPLEVNRVKKEILFIEESWRFIVRKKGLYVSAREQISGTCCNCHEGKHNLRAFKGRRR